MNLNELLPEQTPPPGGLARLRARIRDRERRRWGRRRLVWSLVSLCLVAGLVWLGGRRALPVKQPVTAVVDQTDLITLGLVEGEGLPRAGGGQGGFVELARGQDFTYYRLIRGQWTGYQETSATGDTDGSVPSVR